jgi:glycosyltransferase involved in cell wall biosynthesis
MNGRVDEESVLRNWSTWLAADSVLFNSDFHRKSVEKALPAFLARQPEADQLTALESVLDKFDVLPVGIEFGANAPGASVPESFTTRQGTEGGSVPVIIWPHRWEPDKDPDAFVRALAKLDQHQLDFRLVLAGTDSVVPNDARRRIIDRWSDKIMALGPFPRAEYEGLLAKSDIVVSCAKHDFFGVGVAEAVTAGCVPVLPDALAYPELISEPWHDIALYQPGSFGSRLIEVVGSLPQFRLAVDGLARSMMRFGWSRVAPRLDEQLADKNY